LRTWSPDKSLLWIIWSILRAIILSSQMSADPHGQIEVEDSHRSCWNAGRRQEPSVQCCGKTWSTGIRVRGHYQGRGEAAELGTEQKEHRKDNAEDQRGGGDGRRCQAFGSAHRQDRRKHFRL